MRANQRPFSIATDRCSIITSIPGRGVPAQSNEGLQAIPVRFKLLILLCLYTGLAKAEIEADSVGVAMDIANYKSDWQFDSGVREAKITSISFQLEEKLEAGLTVGMGIGYFDMSVRGNSNASPQDLDGQYLEIYLYHPFPVSERISIHGAFDYRYYSGNGNNGGEREDIDWNEVNLQIGVGVRFAHLRVTPFAAYYNVDGDISDDNSTGSFENEDSVSQGVSLDYFVDDTAFIRLEIRSGYQSGGRISFERRY
jgi:hypothetical protein